MKEGNKTSATIRNGSHEVLSSVHSPEREIDVQKLCDAVLELSPIFWDNPNGPYEISCPFCFGPASNKCVDIRLAVMSELDHKPWCAYLNCEGFIH